MCDCVSVKRNLEWAKGRFDENCSHLRQAALWAELDYWQWRREAPCRCGG